MRGFFKKKVKQVKKFDEKIGFTRAVKGTKNLNFKQQGGAPITLQNISRVLDVDKKKKKK